MKQDTGLFPNLMRLGQLQRSGLDVIAVQEAVQECSGLDPREQMKVIARRLQIPSAAWWDKPDALRAPSLVLSPSGQWGLLRGANARKEWITEWWDESAHKWREESYDALPDHRFVTMKLSKPFSASKSPSFKVIAHEVFSGHPGFVIEALLGGLVINTIALATSFYSMQVYDRVVPTGALQTLLTLTLGMVIAICLETLAKHVRSGLYERVIDNVDRRLSRTVYTRFLAIRLDQLPRTVGTVASQIRGYETVRSFLMGVTTNLVVDLPFSVFFGVTLFMIGGWLAAIPLTTFLLCLAIGTYFRNQLDALAMKSSQAINFKTGLLVETVEGAETIKSGHGGWRMLTRWMDVTDEARSYDQKIRHVTERSQHATAAFQQVSYVSLVAMGATLVSQGKLSMGELIACSILSGRILAPIVVLPSQLIQWSNAKAALKGLDMLWKLEDDHHGQPNPVIPERVKGAYDIDHVLVQYGPRAALQIADLRIAAGEKIAILGPVGAGKTTLLRMLSGMYKPQSGRVLLDGLDLAHISKPVLSEHIGYVQQEGRLFAGTLRENLILGILDPGDEALLAAAELTGLLQTVIKQHPSGLNQEIYEGGTGLSGGQRQLTNLTRVFLRKPDIWLLDEPTASIDRNLELQVIHALRQALKPESTMVLVTHKTELLDLVDRVIVIANHQVMMDGPKALVLAKLNAAPTLQRAA
jgi:ATP-binding cassette subfamily C protein LapB